MTNIKVKSMGPVQRSMGSREVYCGSGCGRGCTYQEYMVALTAASQVAQQLGGWDVEVTENLGWHWKVTHGHWEIRRCGAGYSCAIHDSGANTISVMGDTPEAAFHGALEALHRLMWHLQTLAGEVALCGKILSNGTGEPCRN